MTKKTREEKEEYQEILRKQKLMKLAENETVIKDTTCCNRQVFFLDFHY